MFGRISRALESLEPLMRTGENGEISLASVERIQQLTADLTDAVFEK